MSQVAELGLDPGLPVSRLLPLLRNYSLRVVSPWVVSLLFKHLPWLPSAYTTNRKFNSPHHVGLLPSRS